LSKATCLREVWSNRESGMKLISALMTLTLPTVAWCLSPRLRIVSRYAQQRSASSRPSWSSPRSLAASYTAHRVFFRLYSSATTNNKKRVVFLGTPEVAATTLRTIYEDSLRENSPYELVSVITQPPKARGRKKDKLEPSPVAVVAEELGIPAIWPGKVSSIYFYFKYSRIL